MVKEKNNVKNAIFTEHSRAGDVDLLRGISIILMIMGHVGFGSVFDKYIHAFHMPVWFVISGYFFNVDRETIPYIKKKSKTLCIPFCVFGLFYEIIYCFRGNNQWIGFVFPNHIQIPLNGSLWFLPALYFADVLVFLIIKHFSISIAYIIIVVISAIGSLGCIKLPFSMDSAFVGMGFMLMGIIINKNKQQNQSLQFNTIISLFIIVGDVFLIFLNGYVNMRTNQYAVIPLFWVNAGLMVIALWNICKWIDSYIDLKFIKKIGRDSLVYVCCNQFCLLIVNSIVDFDGFNIFEMIAFRCIKVILIVCICFSVNKIISKCSFKFILGK